MLPPVIMWPYPCDIIAEEEMNLEPATIFQKKTKIKFI